MYVCEYIYWGTSQTYTHLRDPVAFALFTPDLRTTQPEPNGVNTELVHTLMCMRHNIVLYDIIIL